MSNKLRDSLLLRFCTSALFAPAVLIKAGSKLLSRYALEPGAPLATFDPFCGSQSLMPNPDHKGKQCSVIFSSSCAFILSFSLEIVLICESLRYRTMMLFGEKHVVDAKMPYT